MQEIDYNYLKQELWSNKQALTNAAKEFAKTTCAISEQIAWLEKRKEESESRHKEIVTRLERVSTNMEI